MKFKTKTDQPFDGVPNKALCKRVNKNPNFMESCPIKGYDELGEYCVPDLCEYYGEASKNATI